MKRVTGLKRLDQKICKLLKSGTDAVLRSLWDFSSRNPRRMELNCGNLKSMTVESLTREMDEMEGLEDLLEMRDVSPFKLLGCYFANAAGHGYMISGRYMHGGTIECLASVREVYEKTLRQLGQPVLDEEPSKTERTWTSLVQKEGVAGVRREPRHMKGGEERKVWKR